MDLLLQKPDRLSERAMARRWMWSRRRVRLLFGALENEGVLKQLTPKADQKRTTFWTTDPLKVQELMKKAGHFLDQKRAAKMKVKVAPKTISEVAIDKEFPSNLDNERCRKAWGEWLAYKNDRKEKYKSEKSELLTLKRFSQFGPDRFCAAIEYSIAQNWQGIHEEKKGGNQQDFFEQNGVRLSPTQKFLADEYQKAIEEEARKK